MQASRLGLKSSHALLPCQALVPAEQQALAVACQVMGAAACKRNDKSW